MVDDGPGSEKRARFFRGLGVWTGDRDCDVEPSSRVTAPVSVEPDDEELDWGSGEAAWLRFRLLPTEAAMARVLGTMTRCTHTDWMQDGM
jgi:hypothetical protein